MEPAPCDNSKSGCPSPNVRKNPNQVVKSTWQKATRQSPLHHFAVQLQRDEAAVRAALTLPWSTGPVEGQIHRLKLIKRQMYGRAKLDLLRIRVLHAA